MNENEKPWVLVVDDSRVVRKTILKILEPHFTILEAENGVAGARILKQNSRIEAMISDIQMPEMDGYSLICKVRAEEDPALREVPIIVITSAEDEITRERAYACGANDFILKPFNAAQLLECVRRHLKDHQAVATPLVTNEPAPQIAKTAPQVETVVVADTQGSVEQAVQHIDAGLNMLRGQKTTTLAPHALVLVIKFMPLLKYCNARFSLGMDHEIAVFHQRILAVRDKLIAAKQQQRQSA